MLDHDMDDHKPVGPISLRATHVALHTPFERLSRAMSSKLAIEEVQAHFPAQEVSHSRWGCKLGGCRYFVHADIDGFCMTGKASHHAYHDTPIVAKQDMKQWCQQ